VPDVSRAGGERRAAHPEGLQHEAGTRVGVRRSGDLGDADALASELVTNAVVHADAPLQVTCRADGNEGDVPALDWEPGLTIPASPDHAIDARRATGRDLLPSAALSSSRGITYAPAAMAGWFRLRPRGAAPSDPAVPIAVAAKGCDGLGQPVAGSSAAAAGGDADLQRLVYKDLPSLWGELGGDAVAADAANVLIAVRSAC
jgi:hypothetical protein